MIAPFFIAGFDTPSDLCCRIRLYNKGLCPLTPEFIALDFRRSKKEQHQVLLLQTSNNNYGWNKYHAGIFGEVNSTPYPCKSKFQSEVWDNWNLFFQLTKKDEGRGNIQKKCFLAYCRQRVFGNYIMQCSFWYWCCSRANRYIHNIFYYRC